MIYKFLFKAANQLQNQYTNTAQDLKGKYIENEQKVANAEMAATDASKLALRAEEVCILIDL